MFNFKHGHRAAPLGSPERRAYDAWRNMRRRCGKPETLNYKDYGGRGISVCEEWKSYECFIADMEQARNKRNNRVVTINGRAQALAAWASELGMKPQLASSRIHRGWSEERSLTPGRFHRSRSTPVLQQEK